MIGITDAAAAHLRELASEKTLPGLGLRLAVERGGCAGLQYAMSIGETRPGDHLVEKDGAVVSVDPESLPFLKGCTIDYTDGLTGAGFRVVNPSAARSCGCGTSFEPSPGGEA
jgi:iron-sulfur cluster assembly protein